MKKNVILLADVRNWAFDNIAQYLKPILGKKFNVTILYSGDYKTPVKLLDKLHSMQDIDFIHFFYRGYLNLFLENIAKSKNKKKIDFFLNIAVTTGVPDHLFLKTKQDIEYHKPAFDFVDHYYTTSKILHKIYSKISEYPTPWKQHIYDNVIALDNSPNFKNNKDLVVTWVGNSSWGEWYFSAADDPKGFQTVIKPAMESAEKECGITPYLLDSQIQKRSKQEIFDKLRETDILLIAANTDGTPLPLLEAMSCGCAVISSETGIAPELLDQEFIVDRDPQQFVNIIKDLHHNREKLTEIKHANYKTFSEVFEDDQRFSDMWSDLIEATIQKSTTRAAEKEEILKKSIEQHKISSKLPQRLKAYIQKRPLVKGILNIVLKVPILRKMLKHCLFFFDSKKLNNALDDFTQNLIKLKKDNPSHIALYCDKYWGVKHSTKELLDYHCAIPITRQIYAQIGYPTNYLRKISRVICRHFKGKNIILSGGGQITVQLINHLCEDKNEEQQILYLWHGSPSQWSDHYGHLAEFKKFYHYYKTKKIHSIISLKKNLEITLKQSGVESHLLQNFIPSLNNYINDDSDSILRIGLWSAYDTWVKNIHPQLLSLSCLHKTEVQLHTNFKVKKYNTGIIDTSNIVIYKNVLPREELLRAIAQTDITLYITNTECSPMVALESLALNVPCLVGPTSSLYEDDPYLDKWLTVNKVDCPYTIAQHIKQLEPHLNDIKNHLPTFVEKYNQHALELKNQFLSSI